MSSRLYDVIKRPLQTEKTVAAGEHNKYAFEVALDANKFSVREAVEKLFDVKVTEVHTAVMPGKRKRFGRTFGKRSNWKKATVTLAEGDKIDLFGEAVETAEE
ncbi:MAG: 50S ribosomal protein L23 [Myxococcales bacterium]|nr:50S ribosomal protein L23 [Myxococcales bacterium]MCB9519919.1 50S ribosomal protein L23 [Myxococcales bacterium]MCB9533174.1 50S ribosomal protein L23 [Myxococcales bacterium]